MTITKTEHTDQSHECAIAYVVAAMLYMVVAAVLILTFYSRINPDAVAYIQVARHYADGRLDLAVNGYWGPLISWLMVPAVKMGADPVMTMRVVLALAGLAGALGAAAVYRQLTGRGGVLVFIGALCLALQMLPYPLTPDVLLMAAITWYFAAALRLMDKPSWRAGLLAGALGGLAYLTKAYALPFVLANLILAVVLLAIFARERLRRCALALPAAALGLAVVAGPWVAIISHHDGRPEFSALSRMADMVIWAGKNADREPLTRLHEVPDGRLTVWENPGDIRKEYWDELAPPKFDWRYRFQMMRENREPLLVAFTNADALFLLPTGTIVALWAALALLLMRRGGLWSAKRLMLILSIAIYAAGYAITLVEDRYLWPIWPLMLVLTLDLLLWRRTDDGHGCHAHTTAASSGEHVHTDTGHTAANTAAVASMPTWQRVGTIASTALSIIVVLSVAGMTGWQVYRMGFQNPANGEGSFGRWEAAWIRKVAPAFESQEWVASNVWHAGLFTCYWNRCEHIGMISSDPDEAADELADFSPARVLIFDNDKLADALAARPGFTERNVRPAVDKLGKREADHLGGPPHQVRVLDYERPEEDEEEE